MSVFWGGGVFSPIPVNAPTFGEGELMTTVGKIEPEVKEALPAWLPGVKCRERSSDRCLRSAGWRVDTAEDTQVSVPFSRAVHKCLYFKQKRK